MKRLEGKIVLITGAGGGIAKASAKAMAREGAKLGLLEISKDLGRQTEEEINSSNGHALFVETDVTDESSVRNAVEKVVKEFGGLNVIVNCVGGSVPEDKPVHEMDLETWHRVVRLNLLSPFLCSRFGIPYLMNAGGGSIVNFSSVKGLVGTDRPIYASTKGGIVALTRTMAAQYASYGIRVNAIAPGGVATERTARQHSIATPEYLAGREKRRKNYPFWDGVADDIAGAVVFLASEESRMFTGTTFAADGGASSYLKL